MSSKGKSGKCSKFEPQLFRRSLCKNCFKTEAEHREETSALPGKTDDTKAAEKTAADVKPRDEKGGKNVPADVKEKSDKKSDSKQSKSLKSFILGDKKSSVDSRDKSKEKSKSEPNEKANSHDVQNIKGKSKTKEASPKVTEDRKDIGNNISDSYSSSLSSKPGGVAPGVLDTATSVPPSPQQKEVNISQFHGSAKISQGTGENSRQTEPLGTGSKTPAQQHSTPVSQLETQAIPEHSSTATQEKQAPQSAKTNKIPDGTREAGSTGREFVGEDEQSAKTLKSTHSVVSPADRSSAITSDNQALGSGIDSASKPSGSNLQSPRSQHLDSLASGSGISVHSQDLTSIVHPPEGKEITCYSGTLNSTADRNELSLGQGSQLYSYSQPSTGTTSSVIVPSAGEQHLGERQGDGGTITNSVLLSPSTQQPQSLSISSQGHHQPGIGSPGADNSYQQQTSSGTQYIQVEHYDQSGSPISSGSSSPTPPGSSSRGRTRRSRGNSDHLIQDSSQTESPDSYTRPVVSPQTSTQAALIIIPSDNSTRSVGGSSLVTSPDVLVTSSGSNQSLGSESQHVAYHKPTPTGQFDRTNVISSHQPTRSLSADTLKAISGSSLYYYPESDQAQTGQSQVIYNSSTGGRDWYYNSNVVPTRSQTDDDHDVNLGVNNTRGANFVRRRRKRPSVDESAWQAARQRRMAGIDPTGARDEAMMEGTRMLIDSLREKIAILEARTEKIEREKTALSGLLSTKKEEFIDMEEDLKFRIGELEDQVQRTSHEKTRLMDRLKLPESERSSLNIQENEISKLNQNLEDANQHYSDLVDENAHLKQECRDLQLEMEEMHDQFREDEALEFREIQKELEATAKNCRILQFKLRKAERRNEQIESDRIHYEEKIRQLESRYSASDDKQHILELEEELKMAKEVSVRLHDELELVEEKRQRYEEELDRMNDILTESETRRHNLQKDVDKLNVELAKMRDELRTTSYKGSKSKDGDINLAQVMRDLSDSLERENDLKEQMKFSEEETKMLRKKLTDLEEENESINLQLQKISAAKSGRFLRKDGVEKEVVTEREHEMRLEMELAEQEIKVLRRKLDDLEEDNELLMKQIKEIQILIEGRGKKKEDEEDDRPYDEKIRDLAKDIESLKMKLIEKDVEAADKLRLSAGRQKLKKSRSLEETYDQSPSRSPAREIQQDIRRQLEFVQQEASVLREKIQYLERENEKIITQNRQLEMMGGRAVPNITTDDAASENIDLKAKVKLLEAEGSQLRDQIKLLDDRTKQLSRELLQARSKEDTTDESQESKDLHQQLKDLEDECRKLKRKQKQLESQNSMLSRDLNKYKTEGRRPRDWKKVDKCSTEELKDRVWGLEDEVSHLLTVIKHREEETEKMEEELDGYRDDIDKMLDAFKTKEREFFEEIENVQQRNEVLSNLLDLVTSRADSAQKELHKYQDRRGSSAVSGASDVSTGSDDVFASQEGDRILDPDWEAKFKSRIESLENLLAEEKLKVQAAEKKLAMKDGPMTSIVDDGKLREKEKEILQQELAVCQKQLSSANEQIKALKERLGKEHESREGIQEDYDKVAKQLKELGKKEDKGEEPRKAASWRWEKQDLEKQVKEYKKKYEDIHDDLKRQQFKWKTAGDDLAREFKIKEKLEKQLKDVKDESESVKTELTDVKSKLSEIQRSLDKKEKEWVKEKDMLLSDKTAAEKDAKNKDDVIKSKDEIINQKDSLIKQKDKSVKEHNDLIAKKDEQVRQKEAEIELKDNSLKHKDDELNEYKRKMKTMENNFKDKEQRLKKLDDDIRTRDDRLKEKDEILEKINRKLVDKQNEVSDMDRTIREAMTKLDEREAELKKMKTQAENGKREMTKLEDKVKELEKEMTKQKKDLEKKVTKANKDKDKMESELSTIQKEKKALLNDLQDAKEKLTKEQDKWTKEKNKLELDVNQKTEKLKSLESNRGLRQSEITKNLSSEKEKLISEKHKLTDDINKIKKDLKDSKKQWNAERDDLQKIIAEKTKMIEDNSAICERMQKDIDSLKKGQASPTSPKVIPIPVKHEVSGHRIPVIHQSEADKKTELALKARLEEQEILMEADREGLREQYEGQLHCLQEELALAQDKVSSLREENDQQLELLQSSRKALSDLRNRYDSGISDWSSEKEQLQKKTKTATDNKKKLDELQKVLDETKDKLSTEERKAKEAEKKLTTEKNIWNAERASLQTKLKQAEEASASSAGGAGSQASKVSEFRAKFEKFGGPAKPAVGAKKAGGTDVGSPNVEKAIKDAQKSVKDLQSHLTDVEKSREKDKKEMATKLEKFQKDWEKEKKELQEQTKKLEVKAQKLTSQEKTVVDLQCKLHDERASWQEEKNKLQDNLDQAKKQQLAEKSRVTDLLAEVKKLKAITAAIHEKEVEAETETKPLKGLRRSRTPSEERPTFTKVKVIGAEEPDEVKRALDKSLCEIITKALEHISRLAEALQSPVQLTERKKKKKSLVPAIFRRSLSTSEVEIIADKESKEYTASRKSAEPLMMPSYSTLTARTTPSPTVEPSLTEHLSRSRVPHRALLNKDGEYESSTVDRRSFRSSSNRNSIYASGTQSAYTSRDSSPEKGRKKSRYPAAPPSMIITPSHTPRRDRSTDRSGDSFSARDMAKLYAKLSSIEHGIEATSALMKERGRGVRVLTKSTSVDADEPPSRLNLTSQRYSELLQASNKNLQSSDAYDDASKSETLLASIRLGELVFTPGLEKATKSYHDDHTQSERSASLSPRSARRKFYENYPYDPNQEEQRWRRLTRKDSESDYEGPSDPQPSASTEKKRSLSRGKSLDTEIASGLDSGTDTEEYTGRSRRDKYSLRKSAANFIQSVKDKRKYFSKRSSSVDTSVRQSIATSGFQAAKTGAPSPFTPPKTSSKEKDAEKTDKETKKKGFHRRSTSIDIPTIFSSASSRSSSVKAKERGTNSSSTPASASTAHSSESSPGKESRSSKTSGKSREKSPGRPGLKKSKKSSEDDEAG